MPLFRLFLVLFVLSAGQAARCAEAAAPLPREVTINGVELVLIPEGWFWYTVSVDTSRLPVETLAYRDVKIWLDSFYMAKYEARARDLVAFLNSGAATAETLALQADEKNSRVKDEQRNRPECTMRRDPEGKWKQVDPARELPATDLSWALAGEFAAWMGFRLPTEAQWSKAARGTDRRSWPWGNNYPDDSYGLWGWGDVCDPAPVTAYPKGRSPYGLYNMAGNVAEYVADWFNQDFDDALRDGARNPVLAVSGSLVPHAPHLKISKGEHWNRDVGGQFIRERRPTRPNRASIRDGVRFSADVQTVRDYLLKDAPRALGNK